MKRNLTFVAALFSTTLLAGCAGVTRSTTGGIAQVIERNKYCMYTPFRTEDQPGTIFVLASTTNGKRTELTLSSPAHTFDDSVASSDLLTTKDVAVGDSLSSQYTLGASAGAELLSIIVNGELATQYAKSISITLGKPQRAYVLPQETLTANRYNIRDSVLDTLRFYKSRKQIDNVYFVFETLEVSGLTATCTLKSEWLGRVSARDLDPIAQGGAAISYSGGSAFSISFDKPMLIGYKASWIPDTILSTTVSGSQVVYSEIDPHTIGLLKNY